MGPSSSPGAQKLAAGLALAECVASRDAWSRRRKRKRPESPWGTLGALEINLATTYSPTHARAQYHRLWRA